LREFARREHCILAHGAEVRRQTSRPFSTRVSSNIGALGIDAAIGQFNI
jgi:hypothetical protein